MNPPILKELVTVVDTKFEPRQKITMKNCRLNEKFDLIILKNLYSVNIFQWKFSRFFYYFIYDLNII